MTDGGLLFVAVGVLYSVFALAEIGIIVSATLGRRAQRREQEEGPLEAVIRERMGKP